MTDATYDRLTKAIAAFDARNAQDPNQVDWEGGRIAKELLYAQRMSAMLRAFAPEASEALRLAVRCQHICRWELARSDFPAGRAGYLRWRTELSKLHAAIAGEILAACGYNDAEIERVRFLVRKRNLQTDKETQTLEDVICLVFLRYYFDDFAGKHPDDKVVSIVQKTWGKMSARGREAALALQLSERGQTLVGRALQR